MRAGSCTVLVLQPWNLHCLEAMARSSVMFQVSCSTNSVSCHRHLLRIRGILGSAPPLIMDLQADFVMGLLPQLPNGNAPSTLSLFDPTTCFAEWQSPAISSLAASGQQAGDQRTPFKTACGGQGRCNGSGVQAQDFGPQGRLTLLTASSRVQRIALICSGELSSVIEFHICVPFVVCSSGSKSPQSILVPGCC